MKPKSNIYSRRVCFRLAAVLVLLMALLRPFSLWAEEQERTDENGTILAAEENYLLKLYGKLTRSDLSSHLEQGLWLTEKISDEQAKRFQNLQRPVPHPNAYRLMALNAEKELLSEITILPISGSLSWHLEEDLVLPIGTAFVELRTPDGSMVVGGMQSWPDMKQAPYLSDLQIDSLDESGRKLALSWKCDGDSDGFLVCYTPDNRQWSFLVQTTATKTELDLGKLPGGQIRDDCGEIRILAARGLATTELGELVRIEWLPPQLMLLDVLDAGVLEMERGQTIDLYVQAWDPQEKEQISSRIIWMDDRGNLIGRGRNLLLPAERFPVGYYEFSAMTMNAHEQVAEISVPLRIGASVQLTGRNQPIFDREGGMWVPMRKVLEAAGWWVDYNEDRQEVYINGYDIKYTVQSNGDLWQEGFFRGQVYLWRYRSKNWISAQDLTLLGFEYLEWDEEEQVLYIWPRS